MTHPCPNCERTFATLAGMRQHHTKVHGEPLANCTCAACDEAFYDPDSARVYCEDCYDTGGAADWDRGNTETECIECGQQFWYYPSEKSGLYCPDCVGDPSVTCAPRRRSTDGRVEVTCAYCGTDIRVVRSRANANERLFCDRECYRGDLSERRQRRATWTQDDNPQWKGGIDVSDHYGPDWRRARRAALDRDENTCRRCGISADELDSPMEVHHVRPVRTFNDPNDGHELANLITLCRSCHRAVEYQGGRLNETTE
jgi:hypothetical protein